MIPKTIHYCWFGRGKLSPEIEMCIASWRKYCPDYEIKEWNEDNSPMDIAWVRDAYKHKKYAFMADYVRFYALYYEGGIYMDTDMLLVKPLDVFLEHKCFLGREDAYNANMAIIGAEKGNDFCKKCIEHYDSTTFNMVSPPIITRFVTPLLQQHGLTEEDATQRLSNGIVVFQSDWFYPIHYSEKFELTDIGRYVTPNTVGVHLWNKSWKDEIQMLAAGEYKQGFHLVWERFKRTPFLPLRYWMKVVKYFGNYIGIWKR